LLFELRAALLEALRERLTGVREYASRELKGGDATHQALGRETAR